MSNRCRSCGADVLWAETVPGGKNVPLDPPTVPVTARGALVLLGRFAYSLRELSERLAQREAVSIDRAVELIGTRYDAHISHFDSCPQADQHRKARS